MWPLYHVETCIKTSNQCWFERTRSRFAGDFAPDESILEPFGLTVYAQVVPSIKNLFVSAFPSEHRSLHTFGFYESQTHKIPEIAMFFHSGFKSILYGLDVAPMGP